MDSITDKTPVNIYLHGHETTQTESAPYINGETNRRVVKNNGSNRRQLTLHLDTLPDAVMIIGLDGIVNDMNAPASGMVSLDVSEALGRNVDEFLPGLSPAVLRKSLQLLRKERSVVLKGVVYPVQGEAFQSDVSVSLCGKDGDELCLIVRDTRHHQRTEDALKRMHGRLAKAERLEAAGMVSGQIAHDFNNLLTPLLAYPSLIRLELDESSPAVEYLNVLENTAENMAHMTQQLLALSRRGNLGDEVFNVNDVVQHVYSLLRNDSMTNEIKLETKLADDLLPVRGGSDQMLRVVQNLCQNAIDAMGTGGTLSVETKNIYLESPVGNYESVEPGEYVRVAIRDTGPGIPEDIREKVFEPFFTTKRGDKRRGSGLGLSIVHGIINDHHGYADLESKDDEGTTFYLYLPVCRSEEAVPDTEDTVKGHAEKILVLEDDLQQLQVVLDLCKALNYEPTGFSRGDDAIAALMRDTNAYNLVILDMRLNEQLMDGCEVWLEMAKIRPEIPTLLMSGSAHPVSRVKLAQSHGAGLFVKKPLTLAKLGEAISAELQKRRKASGEPSSGSHSSVASSGSGVAASAKVMAAQPASAPAAAAGDGRVLLVEDEDRIRTMFAMVLRNGLPDVEIEQACNGAEALEVFREKPCDVIVMDLHMPVMDGRQAFIQLDEYCRRQGVKMPAVIFCSGFSVPKFLKDIVESRDTPHDLLLKPVRNSDLVEAVKSRLPLP